MDPNNNQEIVKYHDPGEHKKAKNEKPSTNHYEVVDGELCETIPPPSQKQKGQKYPRGRSRERAGGERYYSGAERDYERAYDYQHHQHGYAYDAGREGTWDGREDRGRSRASHHTRVPRSHHDDRDYDDRYSSPRHGPGVEYSRHCSRHRSRGGQSSGPEFITVNRGATADFPELARREKERERGCRQQMRELEKQELEREGRGQEEWEREERRRREKERRALERERERELERMREKEKERERREWIRLEKERLKRKIEILEEEKERERLARNVATAGPGSTVYRDRGIEVDEHAAILESIKLEAEREKMRTEVMRDLFHGLNLKSLERPPRPPTPPRFQPGEVSLMDP